MRVGNSCDYESKFFVNTAAEVVNILPTNDFTEIGKKELSKQLLEIREMYLSRGGHCSEDVNCGFPIHLVKEIISIVSPELCVNDVPSIPQRVIAKTSLRLMAVQKTSSSSDSESGIDFKKYHARICDLFEDDI